MYKPNYNQNQTFSVPRLSYNNYHAWQRQIETYLQTTGLLQHIKYSSFEVYYTIEHEPDEREQRYNRLQQMIKDKIQDQIEEDKEMMQLDELFKEIPTWLNAKKKAKKIWKDADSKVQGIFRSSIDEQFWTNVKNHTSAYDMWCQLKVETQQQEAGTIMSLLSKFFNLKMLDNEKLTTFTARVQAIADQLDDLGYNILSQQLVCFRILCTMPEKYDQIQQAIFQLPVNEITLDKLKSKFAAEDSRQSSKCQKSDKERDRDKPKKTTTENANALTQNRKCCDCHKSFQTNSPRFHRCTPCHEIYMKLPQEKREAIAKERRDKKNKKTNGNKKKETEKSNVTLVMSLSHTKSQKSNTWYLDSGSTRHVAQNNNNFQNISKSKQLIQGPSGELATATLKGDALFSTNIGNILFEDALIVPDLQRNLLSVKRITASSPDILVIFQGTKCEIFKGQISKDGTTVLQGQIDDSGLYAMSDTIVEDSSSTSDLKQIDPMVQLLNPLENEEFELDQPPIQINLAKTLQEWHECLTHINKKSILQLRDTSPDFQVKDPESKINCNACDAAKMSRKKFAKVMPDRAKLAGEAIYSDVCGKISPPTHEGHKYVIHFLDEKSGYLWVYLARKKSEAANLFKEVRAKVNNLGQTTVKYFITDGGGEYISNNFKQYLKDKGIVQAISPPNTPQRVGKSERLNRTLFDAARAMLKNRQIPLEFWGLAILYAAYVRNRTVKSGKDQTRHQLLLGQQSSLKHCLPFGLPVMYHNHDPHIKKLDDRAFKGMFVGFNQDNHAYKIFNLATESIIETRSIKPLFSEKFNFDNNNWDQPFEIIDNDNWLNGGTNHPNVYEIFNDQNFEDDEEDEDIFIPIIQNQQNNIPIIRQDQPNNNIPIIQQNNNDNNNQQIIPPNVNQQPQLDDNNIQPIIPPIIIPPVKNRIIQQNNYQEDVDIMGNPINNKKKKVKNRKNNDLVLSCEEIFEINNLDEINTPQTYKEAMESNHAEEWQKSIIEEQQSLIKLNTFEVVPRPTNKPIVKSRYVFKIKTDEKGKISRFKTRLVAKGYTQTQGVDYFDTFSPAIRLSSLRYLFSAAVLNKFKIHHLDVQTAFLNGDLAEEIYMEIPEHFDILNADRKKQVLKLNKSIYGLKQASRVWNEKFTSTITSMGFIQSDGDPCIFIKYKSTEKQQPICIIGIFVDDCFVLGEDDQIAFTSQQLMKSFNMHDLGLLSYALGIKVIQQNGTIELSQTAYVDKCLEKFQMSDSKIRSTPLPLKPQADETNNKPMSNINIYQQLIGSLIYLSNATRPDIAYAVGYLARSMQTPTEADWMNGVHVLKYLKGSKNYSLKYNSQKSLEGYSDASYAEEKDRKSISGYVFKQAGAAITWRSSKQDIVAQSSMESEYIGLSEAGKEAKWLRKLQAEIFPTISTPTIIYEDNQSAIKLTANPLHSNRSKHIDVRYHSIREIVKSKIVEIKYLSTAEMIADIMTKSLGKILHQLFVDGLGLSN
jgi:hypothetical protein